MTSPARSSAPRPEPVTKAGALAGIVSALLLLVGLTGRAFGWISDDLDVISVANRASDVVLGAGALWSTAAPIALAIRARGKVTPLGDPRDALGRALAVIDDATPIVDDLRHYLDELTGHAVDTITAAATSTSSPTSSSTPTPAPAAEDPATAALLGPSLYDQLTAEQAATATMPATLPAVPATVTGSPTAQPATPAPTA